MPLTLQSRREPFVWTAPSGRLWSALPLGSGAASEFIWDSFWLTGAVRSKSRSVLLSSTRGASPDIAWGGDICSFRQVLISEERRKVERGSEEKRRDRGGAGLVLF